MTVDGSETPFQIILRQDNRLVLTSEQRRTLELLDIDFRSETIRLFGKRQLLELDVLRDKVDSRSGLGFTAKSLAAIDAITTKLRQRWLLAQEQALATLSAEQVAKLSATAIKLPSFDSDSAVPASTELDARVAEALAARIKDGKIVEIETAQAVAERLLGWAKSAAIVTGVPLALLAVVLGILGVSNWTDFRNRIAEGKREVELQLATARRDADEFRTQATALQAQYTDLKKQFGDVSTLASDVRGLSDKVERLEQIQFEQSSALLPEIQSAIEQEIKGYRSYLQSLGYRPPATELKIRVDTFNRDEAFYDGKMITVGANIVNEPDVIYRDYTERMLTETNKAAWEAADWKVAAILSGLADYFPCSFLGDPIFGAKYVRALGEKLPAEFGKRGYLRNLANNRLFVGDSASPLEQEQHTAGEVWGGVFWELRGLLGCNDNTARCVATDKIVLASWTALNLASLGSVDVDVRLAQSVVKNVRESFGAELAGKVHEAFSRRGLVLGPPEQ